MLTFDCVKILEHIARNELNLNFKFHNLMYSHTSWIAANAIPVVVVNARLGHSKIESILRYYTHITDDMSVNLLTKLNFK